MCTVMSTVQCSHLQPPPMLASTAADAPHWFQRPSFVGGRRKKSWQRRLLRWLLLHYFWVHVAYIIAVAHLGGAALYGSINNASPAERSAVFRMGPPAPGNATTMATTNITTRDHTAAFVDALYIAASAVSCTGLSVWNTGAAPLPIRVLWHVIMVLGGTVFLSWVPSLLVYLAVKYRALPNDPESSDEEEEGGRRDTSTNGRSGAAMSHNFVTNARGDDEEEEEEKVERLLPLAEAQDQRARLMLIEETFAYWFVCQAIGLVIVGCTSTTLQGDEELATATTGMPEVASPWRYSVFKVISSFHNSTFRSLVFSDSYATLWTLAALTALGNTLFPVGFRVFLWLQWLGVTMIMMLVEALQGCLRRRPASDGEGQEEQEDENNGLLPEAEVERRLRADGLRWRVILTNIVWGRAHDNDKRTPPEPSAARSGASWGHHSMTVPSPGVEWKARGYISSGACEQERPPRRQPPALLHSALVPWSVTWYSLIVWIAIVAVQAGPFFVPFGTHPHVPPGAVFDISDRSGFPYSNGRDVLSAAGYTDLPSQITAAICQGIYNRYTGLMVIQLSHLPWGHLLLMILAMYAPASVPSFRSSSPADDVSVRDTPGGHPGGRATASSGAAEVPPWEADAAAEDDTTRTDHPTRPQRCGRTVVDVGKEIWALGRWLLTHSTLAGLFVVVVVIVSVEQDNAACLFGFDTTGPWVTHGGQSTNSSNSSAIGMTTDASRAMSLFPIRVVFEVVSGFSGSGSSLTFVNATASFSSCFGQGGSTVKGTGGLVPVSKLMMIATMLLGRQRDMSPLV